MSMVNAAWPIALLNTSYRVLSPAGGQVLAIQRCWRRGGVIGRTKSFPPEEGPALAFTLTCYAFVQSAGKDHILE